MSFKKVVKEIDRLNKLDKKSPSKRMCKVIEEVGELAQAVNKTTGIKRLKPEDTKEAIMANILEEGADSIQCIISLLLKYKFTAKQIVDAMNEKNVYWEKVMKDKKKNKK